MMLAIFAMLLGAASAVVYLLRRKWIDALLVLSAAAGLAGLVGDFRLPSAAVGPVTIDSSDLAPDIGDAPAVRLRGDGLRDAQWHDLPARPLEWQQPAGDMLKLDFPRSIQLGRTFRLSMDLSWGASRKLQLLAENGQVLAESTGTGTSMAVQWIPPVAESMVLRARLLDAAGKAVAEGPVPFQVVEHIPLQVQGRFGAPSFDARTLNDLLADSNAVLDWQVKLGKTVTRTETARVPMTKPDLLVVDAAYIERLSVPARASLLAQVAAGAPLMILGASANDAAIWSQLLKLDLRETNEDKATGAPLALLSAALLPVAKNSGPWKAGGDRIWARPWEKGRIVWIGVGEWHRYAISEPRMLGLWWQDLLDNAGVRRAQEVAIVDPREMPVPGQRLAVCAQGVSGEVSFPALKQTLTWMRRPDRADAACVAVWPEAAGWLQFQWGGARPQAGQVYVYARDDWPLWQKAQRRDATMRYAARTPVQAAASTTALPSWPFAVLLMAAMLMLWWRERRSVAASGG